MPLAWAAPPAARAVRRLAPQAPPRALAAPWAPQPGWQRRRISWDVEVTPRLTVKDRMEVHIPSFRLFALISGGGSFGRGVTFPKAYIMEP